MSLLSRGNVKDMVLGFQHLSERVADAERREKQQWKCSGRDRVMLQRLASSGRVQTLIAAHEGRNNAAKVSPPVSKIIHDQKFANEPEDDRKDGAVVLDAPLEQTVREEGFVEIEAERASVCRRIREAKEQLGNTDVAELQPLEAESDAASTSVFSVTALTEMHSLSFLCRAEAELAAESRRIWEERTPSEISELAEFLRLEAECAVAPENVRHELKIDVDFVYCAAVQVIGAMPSSGRKKLWSLPFECRLPTLSEDENEIAEEVPTAVFLEGMDQLKKVNVNVKRLIAYFESLSD